jgi:hypothetical protein
MQYTAFHTIQAIYIYAMSKLFPGKFDKELATADALVGPADYNIHIGGIHVPTPLDRLPEPARKAAGLTRAAHETILRHLVVEHDKRVEFVSGTVLGFNNDPQHLEKLTGIRYRPTDSAKVAVTLEGDLIIG